jgi:5-methylcytosine-specific restriction endonuclease McrA
MVEKAKLYKPKKVDGAKKYNARKNRDKLYDQDWFKYRDRFLKANPKCYSCGQKSTVVDHLVAHKGDIGLFEKLDNHLPLCKKCHDTITARFDKDWTPEKFEQKLHFLSAMRVKHSVSTSVKVLGRYRL